MVSRFSAPVQNGPGAHAASHTMGTGSFPGVKRPGRGVDHPPTSSAEVKERVELYLYSLSTSSWPVQKWTSLQMDFTSLVIPCCNLFQMSRWYRLASTVGPTLITPTMLMVPTPFQEKIVGQCTLMAAWTTYIALQYIPSYVNVSLGRWQVNLRNINRTDLDDIYSRSNCTVSRQCH